MKYVKLDHIVRSVLHQKQLTQHWYLQFLKYASDCLRELTFDTLKTINTRRLPVTDYKAVVLPCDFVDWTKVGIEVNQKIQPLVQTSGINRLNKFDDSGNKTVFGTGSSVDAIWATGLFADYGATLGRWYGVGAGFEGDTFKYLPERNEIQLNESLDVTEIVLEYISNGAGVDAATKVDPYAQKTIEAYIDWQYKLHSRAYGISERREAEREYYQQLRFLRARKSDLNTIEDFKRSVIRGYKASIKK
jgi:hypothetical protein